MNKIEELVLTLQMLTREAKELEGKGFVNKREEIRRRIISVESDLVDEMRINKVEIKKQQAILNDALLIDKS